MDLGDANSPNLIGLADRRTSPRGIFSKPFNMAPKGGRIHDILEVRAHGHDGLLAAVVRDVFDRLFLKLKLPVELRLGIPEILLKIDAELVQEVTGKDSK
jgi:hypothetical protein